MAVASRAEPCTKAPRMRRISQRPTDLVEHNIRRRIATTKQWIEHIVPRGNDGLMIFGARLAVPAPPPGRIPDQK